ncbi:MAG: two-component regulator propeller domain-containing protein [Anaerolineae bacterium]
MKNLQLLVLLLCIVLLFGGALACDLGGAKQPTPVSVVTVAPQAVEVTPTPSLVTLSDGSQIPLPGDAEMVPVGEGFYIGFTTGLIEPQLFDFYAAWLSQRGWVLVAPTEAVVSQPHQRWRKGELELLIELQAPDERGRTVAWLQVTSPAAPSPTMVPGPTSAPSTALSAPEGPWTNYTSGNEVLALAAGEGYVWAGTRGGAVRWNTADGSYTKYTRDDGLADNEVSAVAVNQAGVAWFMTPAGVSRYDGTQWVAYSSLEEAIEADYAAILSTISGQGLWVVQPPDKVWLASGPVKVYDGQRWTTYAAAHGLPGDDHRVTTVGPDGRVWIGTWSYGLSFFDGQTWTTHDYSNTGYQGPTSLVGLAGNAISAVAVDAAGTVWVGAQMDRMAQFGGLSRFDGQEWVIYPDLLSVGTGPVQHPAIHAIVPDDVGGVWLDTKHGLSHFDGANWSHFAEEQGLPSHEVNALVMDAAGQLWAGTERGLARFNGVSWQAFLTNDGPAANEVRAVAVDKVGRVWFGTRKGLSVFDSTGPALSEAERWRTYTQADGLAADAISALAVDDAGRVWAGTSWWAMAHYPEPSGAGVSVFDGTGPALSEVEGWRTYTQADGLASDLITAIAVDKAGRVWVGSEETGLAGGPGVSVFDGTGPALSGAEGWRIYTTADGLAYDSTSAIAVDAAGNVWLGAHSLFYGGGEGVSVFDGTSFRRYAVGDGLASNEVTAVATDGAGNVWVGTKENGISRYDGQTWTTRTAADGLASNKVTAIAADGAGNVWVGTKDSGVSVFDGAGPVLSGVEGWRTYTTKDGLVDNRIKAIAVDAEGSLWLGTQGGVSHLRPSLLPLVPAPTDTPQPIALPTATPLPPPTATPLPPAASPTVWIPPQPTPAGEFPVTGRYAEVWARLGGAEGRLGQPLDPVVEGFYALQHFEHGLLHWGRPDRMGDPEPEVHIILYGPGDNRLAGQEWYRYIDYWREGDEEYPCPQASPPLGPKRGFGKVWCECEDCRDHLGAPVEGEWGEQGGYQDFQGGVMLWVPREGGLYVLLNQGDWRFEPVE